MGCTITVEGATVEEILDKLKKQILDAFYHGTMCPDSEAVIMNPETKEYRMFDIDLEGPDSDISVKFIPRPPEKGITTAGDCAVAVSVIYHEKPKLGNWQGCVHLH